ncbi:M81 family metallopeptidase [Devosia sp. MC532]|uniref:M81 family metallopeptidase n=1 Tax=Devosia sp. MC532 TaxID=2799788 RepID=UPI0018F3F31B|nr:M81 family metallopeptidase [Devosia sp. MC532]MBJ7577883.1 M81 family metallopeptidase [Devosia sp. MC532]
MPNRRLLLAHLIQEAHSFNPYVMSHAQCQLHEGDASIARLRGTNTVAGGVIDMAEQAGVEVVCPIDMRFGAGGRVEHSIYEYFKNVVVEAAAAGTYDAIVLALHGAMMTTELDDPEADLMQAVRSVVGPHVPITAGFDLHAHVTEHTIAECDYLTAFQTNPHIDMGETGHRLFAKTMDIINGEFEPVCAYIHFPMLTLGNDRHDQEPLFSLYERSRAAEATGRVVDSSIFTVQQFLDIENVGQTILVYGNGIHSEAMAFAEELATGLWGARDSLRETFADLDQQILRAKSAEQKRALILGDQGDRVAGGGLGDSTHILKRVLELAPEIKAAIPITDPAAMAALRQHAVGDVVTLSVGGGMSGFFEPVTVTGELVRISENERYTRRGPSGAGLSEPTGPFAVVRVGAIDIVLTELPCYYIDPNNFVVMGIEPQLYDIVVTRSGYHYTMNFAEAGECVVVQTPGMTSYQVENLPFKRARPIYPLDDIAYKPQRAIRRRNGVPGHPAA